MIKLYNGAFDVDTFQYLRQDMLNIFNNQDTEYLVSYTSWKLELIPKNPIAPVLMKKLSGDLFSKQRSIIVDAFNRYAGTNHVDDEEKFGISYYFWLPGSAIDWHHDGSRTTATFYMNNDWDTDYNGFLVYKDQEERVFAIPPSPNTCVIQKDYWHSVSTTTMNAPLRMTIQVFCSF